MTDHTTSRQPTTNTIPFNNSDGNAERHKRSFRLRWLWFPSLLFGDGMLFGEIVVIMLMLRRYGQDNAQIAFTMSVLCLPFLARPLFEMVVAHFRGTTKVWILSAEFISAIALWGIAFTLPSSYWQQATVLFTPIVVTAGCFHTIAVQRFYLDTPVEREYGKSTIAILFRSMAMLFAGGIVAMLAGNMEVVTRNVRYSWSFAFYSMAGIVFVLWLWHSIFLPGSKSPHIKKKDLFGLNRNEYNIVINDAIGSFSSRSVIYFLLLYITTEAFLSTITPLFIIDAPHNGGMGLSPQEFGLAFGTIGITGVFMGRAAGIIAIHRCGLRRWLLPMTIVLTAHGLSLLYLSYNTTAHFSTICIALLLGGIAFGFGLTGYSTVACLFATSGRGQTLRYAITQSLAMLTTAAATTFSGLLQINIGYRFFFTAACALYILSVVTAGLYIFFGSNKTDN